MTLVIYGPWGRTVQRRLRGCFYEYVDRVRVDSAHQRKTEVAVQVKAIGVLTQSLKPNAFSIVSGTTEVVPDPKQSLKNL
jgi:hypothetical protein